MDWNDLIDWVLKFAGLVDAMFFVAYSISNLIDWIKTHWRRH